MLVSYHIIIDPCYYYKGHRLIIAYLYTHVMEISEKDDKFTQPPLEMKKKIFIYAWFKCSVYMQLYIYTDCRGGDHMVVRFTTTYAISTYHH